MTQQEFEQLTGFRTTETEYSYIEVAYMADDKSKQEFCDTWKIMPEPARDLLIKMGYNQKETRAALKAALSRTSRVQEELLDIMFERAQKMSDPELRKTCIKRMGAKVYIQKLLQGKYSLWEDDRDLIIQNLK